MYVCAHVFECTRVRVCVCVCEQYSVYRWTNACTLFCLCVWMCVCVCARAHACVCVRAQACASACMCIYTNANGWVQFDRKTLIYHLWIELCFYCCIFSVSVAFIVKCNWFLKVCLFQNGPGLGFIADSCLSSCHSAHCDSCFSSSTHCPHCRRWFGEFFKYLLPYVYAGFVVLFGFSHWRPKTTTIHLRIIYCSFYYF